jgi:hypothetical protein
LARTTPGNTPDIITDSGLNQINGTAQVGAGGIYSVILSGT